MERLKQSKYVKELVAPTPEAAVPNREQMVYRLIKQMIFDYQLIPGQKLQYQDLADRFGVSRTPVKNALVQLERESLVKLFPNKGYYIAELSRKEALDLFELRLVLERAAVERAILNFTPEGLAELRICQQRYNDAISSELTRSRFLIDRDFHLQIAVMSGNLALVQDLSRVLEIIFLKHRLERLSSQRGHAVVAEHARICAAIEDRDPEEGLQAVSWHIEQHRANILAILDS